MNKKLKEIVVVLILGLFLPAVVFSSTQKILISDKHVESETKMETSSNGDLNQRVSVLMNDDQILMMDIQDYITAVVLCEMPATFDIEALKAQAVVARTYTMRRQTGENKHDGAAVCTDSACCQGYREPDDYIASGGNIELLDKVRQAVAQTENQVLLYNGKLIDATYFSCSGGMTENAVAVWGADIPYLQATESPGEEHAAHYVDTVKFSTADFINKLKLSGVQNNNVDITDITYTEGGGVDRITICGESFKGTEIRRLLSLRSTAFSVTALGDSVTITTKGFGHRVGMSQYGAEAMAVNGSTYDQILFHYYKGTELASYED